MSLSLKPLQEQVMVITGASSGIGLATARQAAKQGVRLVLAARSDETLGTIVEDIIKDGGLAIHVKADIGKREDVQRIADAAVEQFGGFDTWVNNAAVSVYGRLEEVTEEDHRRLFQTNFWGMVHGSLAALPVLKSRGGALINVGSVASDVAFPLQGMYGASKHAIKGFTNALRMELQEEGAPVAVTLIKPGSIDTPFPEHAKKYTPQQPKLPAPVYAPEEVATAILYAASHPQREIYVGSSARTLSMFGHRAPRLIDKVGSTALYEGQLQDRSAQDREGALYRAGGDGRVRGRNPTHTKRFSLYTRASRHPLVTVLAVATAGAVAYTLVTQSRQRRTRRSLAWYGVNYGDRSGHVVPGGALPEGHEQERPQEQSPDRLRQVVEEQPLPLASDHPASAARESNPSQDVR